MNFKFFKSPVLFAFGCFLFLLFSPTQANYPLWSGPQLLENTSTAPISNPILGLDSLNRGLLLYERLGIRKELLAAEFNQGLWGNIQVIDDPNLDSSTNASIQYHQNKAFVFFQQFSKSTNTNGLYSRTYQNGTWGPRIGHHQAGMGSLVEYQFSISSEGKGLLVYTQIQNGKKQIFFRVYTGSSWDNSQQITTGTTFDHDQLNISQISENFALLAFRRTDAVKSEIIVRKFNSVSWETNNILAQAGSLSELKMSLNSSYRGILAYRLNDSLMSHEYNGSTWSSPSRRSGEGMKNPRFVEILMYSGNRALLTYTADFFSKSIVSFGLYENSIGWYGSGILGGSVRGSASRAKLSGKEGQTIVTYLLENSGKIRHASSFFNGQNFSPPQLNDFETATLVNQPAVVFNGHFGFLASIQTIQGISKVVFNTWQGFENLLNWKYHRIYRLNTTSSGADITGDVDNFPMLIRLNSSNFNFNQALSGGQDLRFADENGKFLFHEIESWDKVNQTASIWVFIPKVFANSNNQWIHMYWGKIDALNRSSPENVFAEQFKGVWHFNNYSDATWFGHDLSTNIGSAPSTIDGYIGKAYNFDGIDDYLRQPFNFTRPSLNLWETFSLSGWVRFDEKKIPTSENIFASRKSEPFDTYGWEISLLSGDDDALSVRTSGSSEAILQNVNTSWSAGNWHHVVVNFYSGQTKVYIDGVFKGASSIFPVQNPVFSGDLIFGSAGIPNRGFWKGALDEIWYYSDAPTPGRIKLTYENQKLSNTLLNSKEVGEVLLDSGVFHNSGVLSVFSGSDTLTLMQFKLKNNQIEKSRVQNIRFNWLKKMPELGTPFMLALDLNNNGTFDSIDTIITNYPMYSDTNGFSFSNFSDTLYPDQVKNYLLLLQPSATAYHPQISAQLILHPWSIVCMGMESGVQMRVEGPFIPSAELRGKLGSINITAGASQSSMGGIRNTNEKNIPILHIKAQIHPDEAIQMDSLFLLKLVETQTFVEQSLLWLDKNNNQVWEQGIDSIVSTGNLFVRPGFISFYFPRSLILVGGSENHLFVTVDLNDLTLKQTDSIAYLLDSSQIQAIGTRSTFRVNTSGKIISAKIKGWVDQVPPPPLQNLGGIGINETTLSVRWNKILTPDAQKIRLAYTKNGNFPPSPDSGEVKIDLNQSDTSYSLTGLSYPAEYMLSFWVEDTAKNRSTASVIRLKTVDKTPPQVTFEQTYTNDRTPVLKGTVNDSSATLTIRLGNKIYSPLLNKTLLTWSLPDNLVEPLPDGWINVQVEAVDTSGNVGKLLNSNGKDLYIDATPPSIFINALRSELPNPTITGSISENKTKVFARFSGSSDTLVPTILEDNTWRISGDSFKSLAQGVYTLSAWAIDSMGNFGFSNSFNQIIIDINEPPKWEKNRDSVVMNQDAEVYFALDFFDPDTLEKHSLEIIYGNSTVPDWIKIDTNKKALKLNPKNEQVGIHLIKLRISDGELDDTLQLFLEVKNLNDAPSFINIPEKIRVNEDSPLTLILEATDPDKDNLTYTLKGPPWLNLMDSRVVGTPSNSEVGTTLLTFTVSDGKISSTKQVALEVVNTNDPPYFDTLFNLGEQSRTWKEDSIYPFALQLADDDLSDSVSFSLSALPNFIKLVSIQKQGIKTRFLLEGRPLQEHVGKVNLELKFKDNVGAEFDFSANIEILAVNDEPIATIDKWQLAGGAFYLKLEVKDEDGDIASTKFQVRLEKDQAFLDTVSLDTNVYLKYPLLDGKYRVLVRAIDKEGFIQKSPLIQNFTIEGYTALSLDSNRWYMVGPRKDEDSVLLNQNTYEMYRWNDEGASHHLYSQYLPKESITKLFLGESYWVKFYKDLKWERKIEEIPSKDVSIHLQFGNLGWNQISNPFPYPVSVADWGLEFYKWVPERADFEITSEVLEPFSAYWVQTKSKQTKVLPANPYFASLSPKLSKKSTPATLEGNLVLKAGVYTDKNNRFGWRGLSKTSTSRELEPPKIGNHVQLFFTQPESNQLFSSSYLPATSGQDTWFEFGIKAEGIGDKAYVSWEGFQGLKEKGFNFYLVHQGSIHALNEGDSLPVLLKSSPTYYQLVLSQNPHFIDTQIRTFQLSKNFPNPVKQSTHWNLSIPQQYLSNGKTNPSETNLTLRLYNLQGQMVEEIYQAKLVPGIYQVSWKKPDHLKAGVYFYKLSTDKNFRATGSMILKNSR